MNSMKSKKDKFIGIANVGTKGQIVIPAEIREMFGISSGDQVFLLADKKKGIAIVKSDFVSQALEKEDLDA